MESDEGENQKLHIGEILTIRTLWMIQNAEWLTKPDLGADR